MKKHTLGFLLATVLLVPMQAEAADYDGIILSIPSEVNLEYADGTFSGSEEITVGVEDASVNAGNCEISISVGTEVTYTDASAVETVKGIISFGTNGSETWTGAEINTGVGKTLAIALEKMPTVAGDYSGNLLFQVTMTGDVERLEEDKYFTKNYDTSTMTCSITGLTDEGTSWLQGLSGNLDIPQTLNITTDDGVKTFTVTKIEEYAFQGNTGVVNVTMPDTITTMRRAAFQNCTSLETVKLSNNLTDMGDYYMITQNDGCENFAGCTSLKEITIPSSLKQIPYYCFADCTSLERVIIEEGVEYVGREAFARTGVKEIVIPASTKGIWGSAFQDCASLQTVTLNEGITSIEEYAFANTGVKAIAFPESMTYVGANAFNTCESLETLVVNNATGSLEFYNNAFNNCTALSTIELQGNMSIRGEYYYKASNTFKNCPAITKIVLKGNDNGDLGIPNFFDVFCKTGGSDKTVSIYMEEGIKNSTVSFGYSNTAKLGIIKEIYLPSTLTSIPDYFLKCVEGRPVYGLFDGNGVMLAGIESIGKEAFLYTDILPSNLTLPTALKTIGDSAFEGCSNTVITALSSGIVSIGNKAFSGCSGVSFNTIPASVQTIGDYTFSGCTSITSLELPSSLTSIGDYAFENCTGLVTLTLPETLTNIGAGTFNNCSALTTVYYNGTPTTKAGISIGSDNDALNNATWVFLGEIAVTALEPADYVVITESSVYEANDTTANVVATVVIDEIVSVIGEVGDWYKIETGAGVIGYIEKASVTLSATTLSLRGMPTEEEDTEEPTEETVEEPTEETPTEEPVTEPTEEETPDPILPTVSGGDAIFQTVSSGDAG